MRSRCVTEWMPSGDDTCGLIGIHAIGDFVSRDSDQRPMDASLSQLGHLGVHANALTIFGLEVLL